MGWNFSPKCSKFLAKILLLLSFQLRWSFLIPKCYFLILSFDNNLTVFYWLKFFRREFVSARVFSKIMFEKFNKVLGEVMLVLLTIFFLLDSKFTSFIQTWMMIDSGFLSSTSSIFVKMSVLVAPGKFSTSTFFVFDNQWLLILKLPIMTTLFEESSFSS